MLPGFCKASPGPRGKYCFSYVTKFRSHHVTYPRRSHCKAKNLKPRNQASQFVDLVIWSIFSPLGQLNAGHFYCQEADFDVSDFSFFVLMNCI